MTWVWPGQLGRLAELPLARAAPRHVRRKASSATWPRRPRHPAPGWTVVSAGLTPVLATGGWLVADAVQPASYSPMGTTISVMSGLAGTDRWIMTGALLLVGACQLVTAAGLAGVRVPARVLLAVAGLSSIGIAVCPEPARGSTPQHLAWTALGAVALALAPAFVARRAPPRPLILSSYGCAVVTAVFIALLGWLVIETQGGSDLGLAERLFLSTETCWPFIVAIALRQVGTAPGEAGGVASCSPNGER
ncbi:MAG: putative integral rane protein [Actinomycetia bacterium]|nr:putative integral rane protein [Actinomycetes bacterium]